MATAPSFSRTGVRTPIMAQAALGLGALAFAIGYPTAGRAALALPIAPGASAADLIAPRDARVLGVPFSGHGLLVRPLRDDAALAALAHGWLLVAVPSTECGTRRHPRT